MNIGTIYSEATGRAKPVRLDSPQNLAEEEAKNQLSLQTKLDWIKQPRTQEVFEEIYKQLLQLEQEARKLALTFHTHNNHQHIIKNLIEASMLREVLNTYGNASK